MKKNILKINQKQALYESIIKQVATTVKKTINEALWDDDDEDIDDEDGPSTSIGEIREVGQQLFKKYINTRKTYTWDDVYDLQDEFYKKIAKELGFDNADEMFCSVDPDDPDEVKWKALQWFTDDLKIVDDEDDIDDEDDEDDEYTNNTGDFDIEEDVDQQSEAEAEEFVQELCKIADKISDLDLFDGSLVPWLQVGYITNDDEFICHWDVQTRNNYDEEDFYDENTSTVYSNLDTLTDIIAHIFYNVHKGKLKAPRIGLMFDNDASESEMKQVERLFNKKLYQNMLWENDENFYHFYPKVTTIEENLNALKVLLIDALKFAKRKAK